jgi:hypothetical protein
VGEGKLGVPCALFVNHSGQRHSDGARARKFSPLGRSLDCSLARRIRLGVRAFQPFGLLLVVFLRFSNYCDSKRDSQPFGKQPKGLGDVGKRVLATV